MDGTSPTLRPEALLEHGDFLRRLARELLSDEHGVEDVLQDAYAAALTRPPRSDAALRSWLARVVRNMALNRRRGERRRAERERAVARPEAEAASEAAAARLVAQRRVVDAVLALREPYRTVVFLRWCEGLPPREIARRLDAPIETIRSQQKRGLAELRERLDAEFGDRTSWALALAPLLVRRSATAVATPAAILVALAIPFTAILAAGEAATSRIAAPDEPVARGAPPLALRSLPYPSDRRAIAVDPLAAPSPAAPSTPAILRVRIVDARDGTPLADVRAIVSDASGAIDDLRTDADGAFASRPVLTPGRVRLRLEDGPDRRALGPPIELELVASRGLEIQVEVGPTFRLDVDPLPGMDADGLVARLAAPDDSGSASLEAPLRDPLAPWVRFPRAPAISLLGSSTRSSWLLSVASRDGLWGAEQIVHAAFDRRRPAVAMELEPRARLEVRVEDPAGAPIAGAELRLSPRGGRTLAVRTSASGQLALGALPVGAATLQARSPRHETLARTLELAPGETTAIVLRLETLPGARIHGTLESRAGRRAPRGRIRLESLDDPGRVLHAESAEGAFALADVPFGSYRVLPPTEDGWPWDPPSAVITVPGPPARFVRLDESDALPIALCVRDAATGERIERFSAAVLVDRYGIGERRAAEIEGTPTLRDASFGGVVFDTLPGGARCWWLVEREGYVSAWGDEDNLEREGGGLVGDVRLERRAPARLWIGTRGDGDEPVPLAGARITTTRGRTLATTLDDGEAVLELVYEPGRLEIALDGWRVKARDGFRRGRPLPGVDVHRVWMERVGR